MTSTVVRADHVHIVVISEQLYQHFVYHEFTRESIVIEAQDELVCKTALAAPWMEVAQFSLLGIHGTAAMI